MNKFIFTYLKKSHAARGLASKLGIPLVPKAYGAHQLEKLKAKLKGSDNILINWGCGAIPAEVRECTSRILNEVSSINLCSNKLKFFQAVKGHANIPEFTEDFEEALAWVKQGTLVFGRSTKGSKGLDIKEYSVDPEGFATSEFWVKYKKKKAEFRIHLFKHTSDDSWIIQKQQKFLRKTDLDGNEIPKDEVDFRIRSYLNGFIFQKSNIVIPDDVFTQAKAAFKISGLDFGAVDVIFNAHEKKAYVLEINTAPGLQGSSVGSYASAFQGLT